MSYSDVFFRYACKELLNKKEQKIINSQLAFNIENLKVYKEVELIHDLLDNLTAQEKFRKFNCFATDRLFDDIDTPNANLLYGEILLFLVAEKEKLNSAGEKLLKKCLKYDKWFNIELQKYLHYNKNLGAALADTATIELHVKLDSIHNAFIGDKHETENVPDYISTIAAQYLNKQKEPVETFEQQHITIENTKQAVENTRVVEECTQPDKNLEVVNTEELPGRSFKIGKWKTVAATVTLLIGLSGSLICSHCKNSSDDIYNNYHETYITRKFDRYAPDVLLNTAMYQYHRENYKEAKLIFIELQQKNGYESIARFYLGLTNMELELFDEAIPYFTDNSLINSDYEEISQWYLALCLVKIDDKEMARYLLNQLVLTRNYYHDKAVELLKELD